MVTPVDDQVKVGLPPLATLTGLAFNDTLGSESETVTVAELDPSPLAPEHESANFVVCVRAVVLWEPLIGTAPFHPPDAVQLCAEVALHCNITDWPLAMVFELGVRVTAMGAALPAAALGEELEELLLEGDPC